MNLGLCPLQGKGECGHRPGWIGAEAQQGKRLYSLHVQGSHLVRCNSKDSSLLLSSGNLCNNIVNSQSDYLDIYAFFLTL